MPKGNVVVSNCIFRDNIGDMEGSVIRATNINIQNSQFINNFANSSDSEGGIIVGKTINAKNSVFTKNRAYRGSGGAINGEKVTCTNCNFTSNSVSGDGAGGAIATRYANIQNCNFVGNKAGDEGGAILFDHKNSVIKNSIFKNNYAKLYGGAIASCGGFNMNNCSFSNNHAAWYGGAIYIASTGKTNKIYNTVFTCNHAKYGGAIYLSDCANLILSKSTFKNNYATYAGALYLEYWASSSTVCKIIDCKFVKNYKKTNKIAIYTGSGDLRIIKNGKTKKIPMEKLLTDSFKAYDSVIVKVKKVYALYKSKKYIVIKFYNGFTKKLIKKGAYDLNLYN